MTDDLNLHVEAIRALFKKRFSGGIEGFPGEFSPDIFKGKADINVNIRPKNDYIEIEWDIVNCESFLEETGKWLRLCPGSPVPS